MSDPLLVDPGENTPLVFDSSNNESLVFSGSQPADADITLAVRQLLIADGEVSDLVGNRVFPDVLKQGTELPALTMFVISEDHEEHLRGGSGFAHARLQFDCYGATRVKANQLARAVRRVFVREDFAFRGRAGNDPAVFIAGVSVESGQRFDSDAPTDGSDEHRYITSQDLRFSYRLP